MCVGRALRAASLVPALVQEGRLAIVGGTHVMPAVTGLGWLLMARSALDGVRQREPAGTIRA
jgi:hypothetical protein